MNFRPSRLVALSAGLMLAADAGRAQQAVLFSKPVESMEQNANSFMLPSGPGLTGHAGDFNAPKPLFNFDPAPDLPPPPLFNPPGQPLKDALNQRKYWTLMTPAEIMGVPTAEKILGLPDPTGDDKRTLEERYLHRQDLAAAASAAVSATNALRRDSARWPAEASPFAPRAANGLFSTGPDASPGSRPDAASRKFFDRLSDASAGSQFGAGQNGGSAWAGPFNQPPPLPKPTVEQIAAMNRFRALMEPSAPPEKSPAVTPFPPPQNSDRETRPLFNPLGQSFTPLVSGVSRPAEATPLPGLTAPRPVAPKKPVVDLPPWLTDGPQPFGSPPRHF